MLFLNKPIYEKTAGGHLEDNEKDGAFSWENTDKINIFLNSFY